MAFSRHTFDLSANLRVRFIEEPAVDKGGPRREFFRLFMQTLSAAGAMFTLTENGIIPVHNAIVLGKDHFRLCGKVLATGIVHGDQSPACFTLEAAHFLVYGKSAKRSAEQMLASIPDTEIQVSLQQVRVTHAQQLLFMVMHASS